MTERDDPCPCGSGKPYTACCRETKPAPPVQQSVCDRFVVTDFGALENWVRTSPEVDFHPRQANFVTRFAPFDGKRLTVLAHVEWFQVRGGWVLNMVSSSPEVAAANRSWLKEQAGAWLRMDGDV
ncbi:MAG TPA: SEC-C metal-binding domain-containing protein [Fibrobacteria bacterium]|nr:SEC-C metal-binding domain-containing protein [Fibrobacteria bacterium]